MRKKKKSPFGTFILFLLLFISIAVFVYAGYRLLGFYLDYKAGTDEYSSIENEFFREESGTDAETAGTETPAQPESGKTLESAESAEDPKTVDSIIDNAKKTEVEESLELKNLPTMKNPIDFDGLNKVNPEVIGWIRVGAVDISYPIAQTDNNDFYLHRTFRKEDNFAGCIFMEHTNSKNLTDQNTIIYGHNMKNRSMFGNLREFANQETYEKNRYFWIYTPKLIYQYEIFSSHVVGKTSATYIIRFSPADFQAFLDESLHSSDIKCEAVPTISDRIVTLSTCTGDDATRRVLKGMLKQIYASEKPDAKKQ